MRLLLLNQRWWMSHGLRLRWVLAIAFSFVTMCRAGAPQTTTGGAPRPQARAAAPASKTGVQIKVADATPEDALRTFMLAVMAQDGAALRAIALPNPEIEWLLKGQPAPPEVIDDAKTQFAKLPIKRLKQGERVALPRGKEYVVPANEVGDDRAVLLPRGSPIPTRLRKVDGRWKVSADPFIAARKAADAAKKKAEAKKAAATKK
jgi:hypothetical protein